MKILFHSNQLSIRGTEVAMYDYAHYNEEILHNSSLIAVKRVGQHHPLAVQKFHARFNVMYYDSLAELQKYADDNGINIFYAIKSGVNDGILLNGVRNCIHVVFKNREPHGEVYAYVSEWLSQEMSGGKMPFVPHMVTLPNETGTFRRELGIPDNAIVFGRHGGLDTFDISFVKRLVYTIATQRPDIYFLFMNTDDFVEDRSYYRKKWLNQIIGPFRFANKKLNNILFLAGSSDPNVKAKFVQTCDAMLHARSQGETFGIACGEFSIFNKPVITCDAGCIKERAHISILGDKGIYYSNYAQLKDIISNFTVNNRRDYDAYTRDFNPASVMNKFKEVFIDS